jgi:hypothetical protein
VRVAPRATFARLVAAARCLGAPSARALDPLADLQACRTVAADAERLACFDREAARLAPPRFAGRHGRITEPFTIERPTSLRFQSDVAIFVMYLKDLEDRVLQNLHLGGSGEDTHLIERPGTYRLEINASESWRIWLEEPSVTP